MKFFVAFKTVIDVLVGDPLLAGTKGGFYYFSYLLIHEIRQL
jgi:hypothetical protein